MALAARQLELAASDDWLRVDDAAALVSEPERTWRFKAASEARAARDGKRSPLAVKRTPESGGKPVWFVHRSIDPRLTRCPTRDAREEREHVVLIARYPQHKIDGAYRKARWLHRWRAECDNRRDDRMTEAELAERIIVEARQTEGPDFTISFRTLQLWRKAYDAKGDSGTISGAEGLIDGRGRDSTGGGAHAARSQEAIDVFYTLYHTENKLSLAHCHRLTAAESRERGWTWPQTVSATHKWIELYDDRGLTFLLREGKRAWSHKYMSYLEQDWSLLKPGEFYVADHHQCDFWCSYDGKAIRPWLTAVQDCGSRRIVGWHLGPKPHQEAILSAMLGAFRDGGIPQTMRLDNGRDFQAKTFTGFTKREARELRRINGPQWRALARKARDLVACDDPRWAGITEELQVKVINAIPYHAWSKGTLERWFGTFENQCGKLFVTYCGNKPERRPECLDALMGDAPTLDQARQSIADYLVNYENAPHAGLRMDSPLVVWAERNAARKAERDALAFLMSIRGEYKVGGNGVYVTIGGLRMGYGANSSALRRYAGRNVLVGIAPDRPAECYAFECGSKRLIATLEPNKRMHPETTTDQLREAITETNRNRKDAKQGREASWRRTKHATELASERARKSAVELRATGTDGETPQAIIRPVRMGFEGVSRPVQNVREAASGPTVWQRLKDFNAREAGKGAERNIYDDIDMSKVDFSQPEPEEPDDLYAGISLSDINCSPGRDSTEDGKPFDFSDLFIDDPSDPGYQGPFSELL